MKPYSLTRRLIFTVLLIELIAALCVTSVALFYERHTHFRAFDVLLHGRAFAMLGAVQDAEDAADNVMLDGTEVYAPPDDIYEVIDDGGRVLGRSKQWPASQPGSEDFKEKGREDREHEADNPDRFFEVDLNRRTYRVICVRGLRIVDPGDKGGGIRRYVTVYYGSSVKRVWNAVVRAVLFYAISSLLVLAATGVLMSWLLNRGLSPLRALADAAAHVSVASWAFSPPEDARRTEELAPLVTAIETVLAGLEQSFLKQKRFVGDAAHELKTGVAVVKSSLQLLRMKPRSPKEYEAGLERCLTDCARMEALVAQMLTLARLEDADARDPSDSRADIFDCLRDVSQQLETMAQSSGVTVLVRGIPDLQARVDPEQFKLLCINLLENALQHSPAGSSITVEISRWCEMAQVRIIDRGDGIHPGELPHIFERFFRSDPSRSRRTGGTGLGLAICKAIVDRAKGSIDVASDVQQGTTVVIRLPLAEATPLVAQPQSQ